MKADLPAPLTPPECDLRDFAFMPLDVVRLRDSDIAAHPDAEVFRAAVLCWSVSWHQVPAASLPDDDAAIARLIGMGRDVKGWKKLRASGALRGFVLCSDGRLYHGIVAEKAVKSWEAKKAQRNRTQKARESRLSQNKEISVTDSLCSDSGNVVSITNASKGEVRDSKGKGDQERVRAMFDVFWLIFPKQVDELKAKKSYFRAAEVDDPERINAGARRYAALCRREKTEWRYIFFPNNWLDGNRWTDGAAGTVIESAFTSAEELEGQRKARERADAKIQG